MQASLRLYDKSDLNMKNKSLYSIICEAKRLVKNLPLPFIISLTITIIVYALLKKNKNRKNISIITFFTSFYFSLIIQLTFIIRIGTTLDPLSNVFGGWTFWQSEFYIYYTSLENICMFIPFPILIAFLIRETKEIKLNNKQIFKIGACSFFVSLSIEVLQIITKLGTFQLSDIVYNTLGGLIGASIYLAVELIINKIKEKGAK